MNMSKSIIIEVTPVLTLADTTTSGTHNVYNFRIMTIAN